MFAIILAAALAAPPQSTLPAEPKCQCSPNCPCKAPATSAPVPKQTAEPPVVSRRWQDTRGDWYETRADGKNYPASTTNAVAPTTGGVVPGGCRVVNGVMVCPTPRR